MKISKQISMAGLLALIMLVSAFSTSWAQSIITIENGEITIEGDDGDQMIMIDADSLQDLVNDTLGEAMDGMEDVLAELDEMQLQIRLGDDNQLSFETDDQMWEVNLDVIFQEIGSALQMTFDDMDTQDWTGRHHFDRDNVDEEEMADELDRLKAELDELRNELNSLKEI